MTDDDMPPYAKDRSEQAKPEPAKPRQVDNQTQESQTSTPGQRATPGRRPLFRN